MVGFYFLLSFAILTSLSFINNTIADIINGINGSIDIKNQHLIYGLIRHGLILLTSFLWAGVIVYLKTH